MSCTHPEHKGWANFLRNEKLPPESVPQLLNALNSLPSPYSGGYSYAQTVAARRKICQVAMDHKIDLSGHRMGRGLLDVWNQLYQQRFGSTIGTAGAREAARRDVKTRLGQRGQLFSQNHHNPKELL